VCKWNGEYLEDASREYRKANFLCAEAVHPAKKQRRQINSPDTGEKKVKQPGEKFRLFNPRESTNDCA